MRWFRVGIASFVLAYAFWPTGTADQPSNAPDSLVQAYAIWQVLPAGATLSFLFLRTERPARHSRTAIAWFPDLDAEEAA